MAMTLMGYGSVDAADDGIIDLHPPQTMASRALDPHLFTKLAIAGTTASDRGRSGLA